MKTIYGIIIFTIIFVFIALVGSANSKELTPQQFVAETIVKIKTEDTVIVLTEVLDTNALCKYILREHCANNKNLFNTYIIKNLSNRLVQYINMDIMIIDSTVKGKTTFVNSMIDGSIKVSFRIVNLKLRDISVEGISLARTIKEEFKSIILSNGIEQLINNLREYNNKN